ncbi:MAG: sulfurtransferase [Rhizobiales bacterium 65-9]|nr:sulfurtransferase [Hyphomicrobiales bacterium]OJY34274.1 MAG: sulfurtransferase [Rhizobiales bacterium 65-9]
MRDSEGVIELDFDEVRKGLADGSLLLVDVREPNEYAAGHIPGAVLFPLSMFDPADLPEPAPGQRIVFSCRTGGRTLRAIAAAQAAGMDLRTHYKGSFTDWVARGGEVETGFND